MVVWVSWARLARGMEQFLAVIPARVEQRSAFSSLQRAERNVQQALIREKQRAWAEHMNFHRIFLLWFSSLLTVPGEVTVNIPSLLSLTPSPSRCSEHDLGEDIYDCVPCEDEGDDIYEDIIRVEVQQPMVTTQLRFHSCTSVGGEGRGGRGFHEGNNSVPLAGDAAGKGIAKTER